MQELEQEQEQELEQERELERERERELEREQEREQERERERERELELELERERERERELELEQMKLNLCCGANCFPGWINIDKTDVEQDYLRHLREAPEGFEWPEPQRELAAWVKAGKPLEFIQYDVRRGLLLWEDASVDAIYIGQAIEHFNRRTEAPALLRECLRVLKPGGAIRLTTPDLGELLAYYRAGEMGRLAKEQPDFYASAQSDEQLAYFLFGASGPACSAENYEGHFHCYTPQSLGALLIECGFRLGDAGKNFRASPFHDTRDFGMSHSFAIEAVKP